MNWAGKMMLDLRRDLHGDGAQRHPRHLLDGKEDQRERAEKHDTALILLQDAKRRDEIDRNYRELVGGKRWRIVPALRGHGHITPGANTSAKAPMLASRYRQKSLIAQVCSSRLSRREEKSCAVQFDNLFRAGI